MKNEPLPARLFKEAESSGKLVYKIEEVSRLTDVAASTIETWEKEFPFLRSGRTSAGKRYFRPRDVEIIQRIKGLLDQKTLTVAGIKRRIEEEFGLKSGDPIHPDKLKRILYDVRDELREIAEALHGSSLKK